MENDDTRRDVHLTPIADIVRAYVRAGGDTNNSTYRKLMEPWLVSMDAVSPAHWQRLMDALARVDEQRGWRPFEQHEGEYRV